MQSKMERAFVRQRWTSKNRNIPFLFTFEQWVAWWVANLGPDWFKKRGQHRGQYCMGRRNDVGPYSKANTICLTIEKNSQQRNAVKCERHPCAKLTNKDVMAIRKSTLMHKDLASQFRVSKETIYRIKKHRGWHI